ncbi:MAG TPA: SAM-dependent methyltransferase, partial [Ktedonobacteraceae bacterium]
MSLQTRILERTQREGAITFADYMQMALYEPDYGYYVTGPAKMGWEGDYITSTDVSTFFAHCVGRQLLQLWQQIGEPAAFHVLEQGAGRGHLAQGIQQWAEQEQPALSQALHYRTADIRAGQDVRSTESEPGGQSTHVILSNELVDAFPVHVVEKRGERLYEVYVDIQDGRLQETLKDPSSTQVASYLDHYKIPWRTFVDGWRAEINLAAEQWLEQSTQLLAPTMSERKKRGFLLVIDYGDKAKELYNPYDQQGTLTCYY